MRIVFFFVSFSRFLFQFNEIVGKNSILMFGDGYCFPNSKSERIVQSISTFFGNKTMSQIGLVLDQSLPLYSAYRKKTSHRRTSTEEQTNHGRCPVAPTPARFCPRLQEFRARGKKNKKKEKSLILVPAANQVCWNENPSLLIFSMR